jgi:hypothetical protein
MSRQRPPVVMVMAILNFVFGGLFLLYGLCCEGFNLVVLGFLQNTSQPATINTFKGSQPNPLGAMGQISDFIPGLLPVKITTTLLGLFLAAILIIGGIGLLAVDRRGRRACIGYGILQVFLSLFCLWYKLFVENPGMARWQAAFSAQIGMGPARSTNTALSGAFATAGFILSIAYAIALLIVMFLPNVEAAFEGGGERAAPEPEDYHDPIPPVLPGDDRIRPQNY